MEVITWLLKMNGVPDVPTSTYKLKKIGKAVTESCNVEVRRFLGAFGHTYYIVSPKSLVGMVCMLLYSLGVYHDSCHLDTSKPTAASSPACLS